MALPQIGQVVVFWITLVGGTTFLMETAGPLAVTRRFGTRRPRERERERGRGWAGES